MVDFMLQCLRNDRRIAHILNTADYWVYTLLDPRYRDNLQSLITPLNQERKMREYPDTLVHSIVFSSPTESNVASALQSSSTCGTAMGSNVALAYANLYMDHFEREYVYANPTFQQNALVWYRYIDDIFCIWQGNHTSLQGFFEAINTTRPELTFTLTYHNSEVTFLDTKVLKNSLGNLSTDLYSKPTDCNSLLLYNSCHPKSTKDSLPRSQFKRVSRIVSDPELKATRLQEMSTKFKARNYPADLLETESTKILYESENDTIKTQKKP
ncbi:unnamed protein product [Ranitomeya imitator]|uniref:Helix-turn-helix domain-containing protein n=1 Tax=Ranitomeya imitator TaxID=111125 RepID=A0ABN9LMC2_9NEOB|nr:unnamed protein product [Ranitomeya imitator]